MLADRLASYAAARNVHYGWVVAALAFFYILFASSAVGIPSVLIRPISDELGLTISELSASQGVRFALFGLSAGWVSSCILLRLGRSQFAGARVQRVAGDCHSGGDDLEFRLEQSVHLGNV